MPHVEFFSHLGLFVRKHFLDEDACARIRAEVRAGDAQPRKVIRDGVEVIDEDVRKSSTVGVSASTHDEVEQRLLALRPDLERHFGLQLPEHQPPYFGAYKEGDFFLPHVDGNDRPDAPDFIKSREVTAIVFLNDHSDEPRDESFGGGSLVCYGLIDDPAWIRFGFPVAGEAGTLIAFRADVVHEVEPVTHGIRYTAVCRFCSATEPQHPARGDAGATPSTAS